MFSLFALPAIDEIAGCYATYAVLRQEKHPLWLLVAVASLVAFAWLLTLAPRT